VTFPEKQQDQQDWRPGDIEVFTGELFINNKAACFFFVEVDRYIHRGSKTI